MSVKNDNDTDQGGLETLPDSITTWQCDVGDSDALDAIFDEILPDGLDVLVNNAGVSGPTKLVEEITNDEWDQCMSICIDSHFYCARRAVPVFKEQGSGAVRDRNVDAVLRRPTGDQRSHRLPGKRLRTAHFRSDHRRRREHRNAVAPLIARMASHFASDQRVITWVSATNRTSGLGDQ